MKEARSHGAMVPRCTIERRLHFLFFHLLLLLLVPVIFGFLYFVVVVVVVMFQWCSVCISIRFIQHTNTPTNTFARTRRDIHFFLIFFVIHSTLSLSFSLSPRWFRAMQIRYSVLSADEQKKLFSNFVAIPLISVVLIHFQSPTYIHGLHHQQCVRNAYVNHHFTHTHHRRHTPYMCSMSAMCLYANRIQGISTVAICCDSMRIENRFEYENEKSLRLMLLATVAERTFCQEKEEEEEDEERRMY